MTRCSLLPAIVSGLLAIALSGCCAVDSGIKNSGRGISSVEKVRLGGLGQFISIHGDEAGNPPLFLHGGPGVPEMPVAHLTGITPRVASVEEFRPPCEAVERLGNREGRETDWPFTCEDSRVKLKSLYPSFQN